MIGVTNRIEWIRTLLFFISLIGNPTLKGVTLLHENESSSIPLILSRFSASVFCFLSIIFYRVNILHPKKNSPVMMEFDLPVSISFGLFHWIGCCRTILKTFRHVLKSIWRNYWQERCKVRFNHNIFIDLWSLEVKKSVSLSFHLNSKLNSILSLPSTIMRWSREPFLERWELCRLLLKVYDLFVNVMILLRLISWYLFYHGYHIEE